MANQLKMAEINSIVTLHKSGKSQREIARLLGIHRETVAKYVAGDGSKPAKPDHRVRRGPESVCEPFRETIFKKLDQGLSGQHLSPHHR